MDQPEVWNTVYGYQTIGRIWSKFSTGSEEISAQLSGLYNNTCDCCGGASTPLSVTLAFDAKKNAFDASVFTRAMKHLYEAGKYEPEMLQDDPLLGLVKETNRVLAAGLNEGIRDNQPPEAMLEAIRNDVFVFSGYKTHQELSEVANMLLTPEGTIKPFNQFRQEVQSVHRAYNVNYLEAEYIFATSSAEMAARWGDFEKDGDRYNLQYRTAEDTKVRDTHRALRLTTLPVEDPFWDSYFPPNGWRCRCTTVQVRKGKFEESISAKQIAKGEVATSQIDKKGNNAAAIFRYNPGKQKVIFPPNHPYRQVQDAVKVAVEALPSTPESKSKFTVAKKIKSLTDLNSVLWDFDKHKPGLFAKGFKSLNIERKAGNNGSTDRQGSIWLKRERIDHVIDGLNNIRQGHKTTFNQEDSLSTLWHEITHNRNSKPAGLTMPERRSMELANEFVSRNTLSGFMKDLGGELQNTSLINDRISTGYNPWVRNYTKLIEHSGADPVKVLNDVEKHLVNESYTDQTKGLVDAIVNNSKVKITNGTAKKAVIRCIGESETGYENYLKTLTK